MAAGIVFREIHSDDMDAIFDVRVATWHNDRGREEMTNLGITRDSVREMMKQSHRGWLCEIDSRVVGFAMGNSQNGEMWVIAVLKEYEEKGIGKRLLGLVEGWLFSEGWDEIWLTTDPDESIRAVGFYRHLGWIDWKVEPDGDRFMKRQMPTSTKDESTDMVPEATNLAEKLSTFSEQWSPKIIAEMDGFQFKLVKLKGDFIWHRHSDTDEAFLVLEGQMQIEFRDGPKTLNKGELLVVPKGVEHRPVTESECCVLLFEREGTVNTGDGARSELTADSEMRI